MLANRISFNQIADKLTSSEIDALLIRLIQQQQMGRRLIGYISQCASNHVLSMCEKEGRKMICARASSQQQQDQQEQQDEPEIPASQKVMIHNADCCSSIASFLDLTDFMHLMVVSRSIFVHLSLPTSKYRNSLESGWIDKFCKGTLEASLSPSKIKPNEFVIQNATFVTIDSKDYIDYKIVDVAQIPAFSQMTTLKLKAPNFDTVYDDADLLYSLATDPKFDLSNVTTLIYDALVIDGDSLGTFLWKFPKLQSLILEGGMYDH